MAKFLAKLKGNNGESVLGEFTDESGAIDCAVKKVRDMYSNETTQARDALEKRGYYCMQWSQYEVLIDKVE